MRELGSLLDPLGIVVELGMENCILGCVAGMDVLHEGGEVPIRREVGCHEVPIDHFGGQAQLADHVGEVEADLSIGHVHLELAEGHAVVGPGDELGCGGAEFLLADAEGVERTNLEVVVVVGDPGGEAVVRILAAHGEGDPLLLGVRGVVEVL